MAGLECIRVLKERFGGRDPTAEELAEVTGLDVPFCEQLLLGEKAEAPEEPEAAAANAKPERKRKAKAAAAEGSEPTKPPRRLRKADDPKFQALPPVFDDRQRESHEMDRPEVPTVDLECEDDTQVDGSESPVEPAGSQPNLGQQPLVFQAWVISFVVFWYLQVRLIFGCF